jgi:acetate kinase
LISSSESRYPIYKVRTDEETMICWDTINLIDQKNAN